MGQTTEYTEYTEKGKNGELVNLVAVASDLSPRQGGLSTQTLGDRQLFPVGFLPLVQFFLGLSLGILIWMGSR